MQLKTSLGSGSTAVFKSRYDSRTQTEGLSPYWYRLNTAKSQANTTSSRSRKATNTESTCSSATDTSNSCNSDITVRHEY
jgi:hypothetical protein